jgi:CrcB protein
VAVVSYDELHTADLSLGRVLRRLALIFAGGCVGGLARYAVTDAWTTSPFGFPWSTFAVNVAGAFILGMVVVVATERGVRHLRLLLGTGFCGALTTFSSVVVATDQLLAHGRAGTAAAYVVLTVTVGIAAASVGLVAGRVACARW